MPSALTVVSRLLTAMLLVVAASASAQSYPQRPVKLVVGQQAGSGNDNIARSFAQALSEHWGQSVVVENRPGAGGGLAVGEVAHATPDGYTLLLGGMSNTIIPSVIDPAMTFDPVADFVPIGRVATIPFVIAANIALPATSMRQLVELARARPGQITYGTLGRGSLTTLNMGLLQSASAIELLPIEYKGVGNAILDLVAGRIDLMVNETSALMPHVQSGKLRVLAAIGQRRAPRLPDVPTMVEQGFPTVSIVQWYGLLAPAQTPPETIARLREGYAAAMQNAAMRERFATLGYQIVDDDGTRFAAAIRDDVRSVTEQARATGQLPVRAK